MAIEGAHTTDNGGLNYGVTNGDDKWMDKGYIFMVNHSGLLNCILSVKKREESGVCFLLEQLAGWLCHFLIWRDIWSLKPKFLFLPH